MSDIETFLKSISVAFSHIDSYNRFVTHELANILEQTQSTFIFENKTITLSFENIYVPKQTTTPQECRSKNLCYLAPVYASFIETTEDDNGKRERILNHCTIAHVPVMVGSNVCALSQMSESDRVNAGECFNDPGGYFIINGIERVLVAQERNAYNMIYIERRDKEIIGTVRSMSEETNHSIAVEFFLSNSSFTIFSSFVKKPFSLVALMKYLGFPTAKSLFDALNVSLKCFEILSTFLTACFTPKPL
jgi:DNA-directed RNA polymerase beta subunit